MIGYWVCCRIKQKYWGHNVDILLIWPSPRMLALTLTFDLWTWNSIAHMTSPWPLLVQSWIKWMMWLKTKERSCLYGWKSTNASSDLDLWPKNITRTIDWIKFDDDLTDSTSTILPTKWKSPKSINASLDIWPGPLTYDLFNTTQDLTLTSYFTMIKNEDMAFDLLLHPACC